MISLRTSWFGCLLVLCWSAQALCGQNLPPSPARYVEDKAGLLSPAAADQLNSRLEAFERETSNQLVVAIYPKLPEGADLAQFSTATFEAWGVGRKREDNGVVLFIFSQDRKVFIATGRGLEGALPDAICKTIITQEIVPRFRQGDYAGGITSAVDAITAAAKGEYQGNGKTVADTTVPESSDLPGVIILLIILGFFIISNLRRSRPVIYTRRGSGSWSRNWTWGSGGGGSGWGGGGSSGGSSGGFSGGGGSSSGGGAGGSW